MSKEKSHAVSCKAPKADDVVSRRIVLVGTYKGDQLKNWRGWYNYPITSKDKINPNDFAKINELWLFQGTSGQRKYKAEFVGVKTREELVRDYGYPAKGKPHGDKYLLFKTGFKYTYKSLPPEDADEVIVRVRDFATSPKVRKQLREYLVSSDRNDPDLAKRLPEIILTVPHERLCVCEAAVQLDLFAFAGVNATADAIKVIELFAGVGGFRIGLERASNQYKTVWSNQWEPSTKRQDASIIYQQRFGMEGHSNEDISKVPVNEIPQADLLVGGFPCQDYSVATTLKNSGGIQGKKGVLWWQIHRILRDSKNPPNYLFLENVDRLLKSPASQRGRDFAIILASLADLGYFVEWRVINAADYGMPQRRRRTYIVAYRERTRLAREAAADIRNNAENWIVRRGVIAQAFACNRECGEALKGFEIVGTLPEITKCFNKDCASHSPFKESGLMVNRHVWTCDVEPIYNGRRVTLGQVLVDESEVPEEFFIDGEALEEWRYLKGPKSETRTTPEGFEYHYSEGGMAFPDALDKPSRTIITGEGGSSPSRFKHVILTPSGRYRRLIPLELERLNMFPDHHTDGATDGRRAFLMGNALVTGIIEKIGLELAKRV